MLEQQERSAVQPDRGLAGAGPTLHNQALIERRSDHDVLLGLDGGDDLAHRTGARCADLGEHRIGNAGGREGVGIVELLVEVGRQIAVDHREPAAVTEAERVDAGGPVERRRDRRPPVDHHRIVRIVLDVPAADVPLVGELVGDAPEEVAGTRAVQILQCFGNRHFHVLLRDLVGRCCWIDLAEPLDHGVAASPGEGEVLSFGDKFGKQVSVHGVGHSSVRRRRGSWAMSRPVTSTIGPWKPKTSSKRPPTKTPSKKSC